MYIIFLLGLLSIELLVFTDAFIYSPFQTYSSRARFALQLQEHNHGEMTEKVARAISFDDAQVLGEKLATVLSTSCKAGEPMPEEAVTLLRALISTTAGARGWFVTLLTNPDFDAVFQSPIDEALLQAICDNPTPNIRLMTMNVAMSTATELAHLRMGNEDMAAGSRMTRDRSTVLVVELIDRLPGLREAVGGLLSAVKPEREDGEKEWADFCVKWGYDEEQKEAIRNQVEPLLL